MLLYHGSDHIVEAPRQGGGKRTNDYGYGFYMTEHLELAKEWACAKGTDGFANIYEINLTGLRILRLNDPMYSILNWLAVLARYRTYWQNGSIAEEAKNYLQQHYFVDPDAYDVVIGYRADDSYFTFAQDFVAGVISVEKLKEAMHLGKLGEQVVVKSQAAFERLQFQGAEVAEASIYYEKKVSRDQEARRQYRLSVRNSHPSEELYMLDIMREGITNEDPRLR
ncbi:MAG: DUF3990 domain-containing protein [Lachnospiraceae bacterium]|nr:DUF3990 domain-containing protein [Lachnospiraceae bacterium]